MTRVVMKSLGLYDHEIDRATRAVEWPREPDPSSTEVGIASFPASHSIKLESLAVDLISDDWITGRDRTEIAGSLAPLAIPGVEEFSGAIHWLPNNALASGQPTFFGPAFGRKRDTVVAQAIRGRTSRLMRILSNAAGQLARRVGSTEACEPLNQDELEARASRVAKDASRLTD